MLQEGKKYHELLNVLFNLVPNHPWQLKLCMIILVNILKYFCCKIYIGVILQVLYNKENNPIKTEESKIRLRQ